MTMHAFLHSPPLIIAAALVVFVLLAGVALVRSRRRPVPPSRIGVSSGPASEPTPRGDRPRPQ
jgi:hypothetical protein